MPSAEVDSAPVESLRRLLEELLPLVLPALPTSGVASLHAAAHVTRAAVQGCLSALCAEALRGLRPAPGAFTASRRLETPRAPTLRQAACCRLVAEATRHAGSRSTVAAGAAHAVFLRPGGLVYVAGRTLADGEEEQQDLGEVEPSKWAAMSTSPRSLQLPHPVVSVACGAAHSLLLDLFGGVHSFGRGEDGQLGHGDWSDRPSPWPVAALAGCCVLKVAAGTAHSMAVGSLPRCFDFSATPSQLFAWGLNEEGQLGIGSRSSAPRPTPVSGIAHRSPQIVSCGDYHSAAVTASGELFTWGYGRAGRLGHGHEEDCVVPGRVKAPSVRSPLVDSCAMREFIDVTCGSTFTIATLGPASDSTLWAAGSGWEGQLGVGRMGQGAFSTELGMVHLPPQRGRAGVWRVAARSGVVAIMTDGTVLVWGAVSALLHQGRLASPSLAPLLSGAQEATLGFTATMERQPFVVVARDDSVELWRCVKGQPVKSALNFFDCSSGEKSSCAAPRTGHPLRGLRA